MTKNHPRVAERAASDSETNGYQKLLDAEILPRLERPGRYLGPFEARGIVTERARITRLALLWPSVPESHHTPAGLAPVKLALESRHQLLVELVSVPAPDAVTLLTDRGLPVFSRPSGMPLASFGRLLLWIEHPGQLLGLLTLLRLGGMEARACDRDASTPELIAAGPLAFSMPELLGVWCETVIPSADPREILSTLDELPVREIGPDPDQKPPAPPYSSEDVDSTERVGDVPAGEGRVRPRLEGAPAARLTQQNSGFGGARVTRIHLGAASEPLREKLGLIDSARLRELCVEALAHESGQLEIELSMGLPGESPEDRAAIPAIVQQLIQIAPRGARQLKVLIAAQLPGAQTTGLDPELLPSCLEQIRERMPARKLRVQSVGSAEFRVSTALLQRGSEAAAFVEEANQRGAWHGDVDASFHETRWLGFSPKAEEAKGGGETRALADASEAAPTGLETLEPLPPTLDENGHPLHVDEDSGGRRDRWRRWSALVPREYQLRLVFEKRGSIRHLSHREMADLIVESCRRAGVPLGVAGVVSPRPKMSFGPSLPVGVEGYEEFVDLSLTRKVSGVVAALNEHLPQGLLVRRARYMPPGAKCAHAPVQRARYLAQVPFDLQPSLREGVADFRTRDSWWIERKKAGEATGIDLKSQITRLHTDESAEDAIQLYFECDLSAEGMKLRPHEFVAALLDSPMEDVCTLKLCREQLLSRGGEPMGAWRTPLELVELAMQRSRQMVKRYS